MNAIVDCLREHRFAELFIDCLGWERAHGKLSVTVAGRAFDFVALAHKHGLQVLACTTDPLVVINRKLLRQVHRQVAQSCHEHILIYACDRPRKQIWQWCVRRPDGPPARHREPPFFSDRPPSGFAERLARLRFTLEEEAAASRVDALWRVREALDAAAERQLFVRQPLYAERSAALLAAMARGEPGACDQFIELHMPLARTIARTWCVQLGLRPEDAAQLAYLGLLNAIRRFDPKRGYQFSTYAYPWIREACRRHGLEFALLIRVPDHIARQGFHARRQLERVTRAAGSAGAAAFLAGLELCDPKRAWRWRDFERAAGVRSLSDRRAPEYRQARQLAARAETPRDDDAETDRATLLHAVLDQMQPRHAQVLRLRYGLDGCPPQTLREIGALFGLTRERIRQIQRGAEKRLRQLIGKRHLDLLLPENGGAGALVTHGPPPVRTAISALR